MLFKNISPSDFFTYYYTSNLVDTFRCPIIEFIHTKIPRNYYSACIEPASGFYEYENSQHLSHFLMIIFKRFSIRGSYLFLWTGYSQCYVGSNGYITFTAEMMTIPSPQQTILNSQEYPYSLTI
jgi:hypothetical protein